MIIADVVVDLAISLCSGVAHGSPARSKKVEFNVYGIFQSFLLLRE